MKPGQAVPRSSLMAMEYTVVLEHSPHKAPG
jgi:hypothetical protein